MSKSEKRYFKLFSTRHTIGEKNFYMDLFDAVDAQETYNEKELLQKFDGTKMAKNLSSVKVQLTTQILRSLRQYKGNKKKKYDVRAYLDYADILFEKGLYNHCQKVLQKAKKLALEYDLLVALDEISVIEHEIAIKTADLEQLHQWIGLEHPNMERIRDINNMLAEYEQLAARMRLVSIGSKFYPHLKQDELDSIINHPLMTRNVEELNYLAQIEFHHLWALYGSLTGNFDIGFHHRKRAMDLLEQKPHKILDTPRVWIYHARLMLILHGSLNRFKDYDSLFERIEKFVEEIPDAKKTVNLKTEIYTTLYNTKLDIDIDRGRFSEGLEFADKVEKIYKDFVFGVSTDGQMVLLYNLAYLYFGAREFHKALHWCNELLNQKNGKVRLDIQSHIRLVNILIHYELGNYELIEGLIRSTDRFLTKMFGKNEYERNFLKFASKYLQEPFSENTKDGFVEFYNLLQSHRKDAYFHVASQMFSTASWLKSRIDNTSMEEEMKASVEA